MLFKRKKKASKKARAANVLKKGFGVEAHRAGWSLIRMPIDVLRRRRETGEDPGELKQLSFEELLERWQIPKNKISYLKRTLIFEMLAFIALMGLGLFSIAYNLLGSEFGLPGFLLGLLISLVALLQLLMRHHWYSILSRQKYRTFRDYILRKEG